MKLTEALGRQVFPISDITSLSNARVALQELEGAVDERDAAFTDVTKVPAFIRYKSNLDAFLAAAGSNIKLNGEVVETPQAARASLPTLLSELKEAHLETIRLAGLLAKAMEDYALVNLPALVAAGVIARSREVLSAQIEELEALSSIERLETLRTLVLDLIAQKQVVQKYGSFAPPSSILSVAGSGTPYGDATHPTTPAFIRSSDAPFGTRTGRNILDLWLDTPVTAKLSAFPTISINPVAGTVFDATIFSSGGFGTLVAGDIVYIPSGNNAGRWIINQAISATLVRATRDKPVTGSTVNDVITVWPASFALTLRNGLVGDVRSSIPELYESISAPVDTTTLELSYSLAPYSSSTPYTVVFAEDFWDADGIATFITSNCAPDIAAEAYFQPLIFSGVVNVVSLTSTTSRLIPVTGDFAAFTPQLLVGDLVVLKTGPNAGKRCTITSFTTTQINVSHTTPALTATVVLVEMGRGRRVRLLPANLDTAIAGRARITVTGTAATAAMLGYAVGQFGQARPLRAQELVDDITNNTIRVAASVAFTSTYLGRARSEPLAPTRLVLYKLRTTANVISAQPISPFTVVVDVPSGDVLSSEAHVGDTLVLRTGSVANLQFTITAVSASQITATGLAAAAVANDLLIEVGPTLSGLPYGSMVNVPSGPNRGDHHVDSQRTIPFEFELQEPFNVSKAAGSEPVFMEGVAIGTTQLKLASANTTTASYIRMAEVLPVLSPGPAGSLAGLMTTKWFQLPEVPSLLVTGDNLELHQTLYNAPSSTHVVVSIDPSLRVLEVSPDVGAVPSSWNFSEAVEVPFARLRSASVVDFDSFKTKLEGWLAAEEQQPAFFVDLNRFINPLLINTNPTASQVNDARNKLLALSSKLTIAGAELLEADTTAALEDIVGNYNVEVVSQVDDLLVTMAERGADRAKDLLLEGRFSAFFSLTVDSASYAGDMLAKMRLVAQQDLPVSKVKRTNTVQSAAIGQTDSPDYEYDASDSLEQNVTIDPPVQGESV